MTKTARLERRGDGYVLEIDIDSETLEAVQLEPGEALEITPIGRGFAVTAAGVDEGERAEELRQILAGVKKKYGKVLERLAK